MSQEVHHAGAYNISCFSSTKQPARMECESITGLPPAFELQVPIDRPGWREELKEWSVKSITHEGNLPVQYRSDIRQLRRRVLYAHTRMGIRTCAYGYTHMRV